jgi:hypothetical protein
VLHGAVERGDELRAVPLEPVERAGVRERLEDALVAGAQVDALAEVVQRGERLLLARP